MNDSVRNAQSKEQVTGEPMTSPKRTSWPVTILCALLIAGVAGTPGTAGTAGTVGTASTVGTAGTVEAVEAPVSPLIYDSPVRGKFEVVWFSPGMHSRTVGNLFNPVPGRYAYPSAVFDEALISNRLDASPPFVVYRVATIIDRSTPPGGVDGDQLTPVSVQITPERSLVTSHPTDMTLGLHDSLGLGYAEIFPALGIESGNSVYVAFQWQSGALAPLLGIQDSLGALPPQEIVYRSNNQDNWAPAGEIFSSEIELLSWKPASVWDGYTFNRQSNPTVEFTVWHTPDTTRAIENAWDSKVFSGDTLSWVTNVESAGYVMIAAQDSAGNVSDTLIQSLAGRSFDKLSFNQTNVAFDWRSPNTLSQSISIRNLDINSAHVTLTSDYPDLLIEPSTLDVAGNQFKIVKLTASAPPPSFEPQTASLYVHNDRGWPTVKFAVTLTPDIQTSVDEDEEPPKPLSFEASDMYPNPVRDVGFVRITAPTTQRFYLEVFNVLGQLISSEERVFRGTAEIPVRLESTSDLPIAAGIYFVRITSGDESVMRKMMFLR